MMVFLLTPCVCMRHMRAGCLRWRRRERIDETEMQNTWIILALFGWSLVGVLGALLLYVSAQKTHARNELRRLRHELEDLVTRMKVTEAMVDKSQRNAREWLNMAIGRFPRSEHTHPHECKFTDLRLDPGEALMEKERCASRI